MRLKAHNSVCAAAPNLVHGAAGQCHALALAGGLYEFTPTYLAPHGSGTCDRAPQLAYKFGVGCVALIELRITRFDERKPHGFAQHRPLEGGAFRRGFLLGGREVA